MKITISGSIKFADKLVDIYNKIKATGNEPLMHQEIFNVARGEGKEFEDSLKMEPWEVKRNSGVIRWWHDCIKSGDALLACNFDKNGIKNYIGANTFLEIGFAYANNKKVFLLNDFPEQSPYLDEVKAMVDSVINGDLNLIK